MLKNGYINLSIFTSPITCVCNLWLYLMTLDCFNNICFSLALYCADPDKIYPVQHTVMKGDSASFICLTDTRAKWSFNDEELPSNVNTFGKGFLNIKNIAWTNQGYYICEGTAERKKFYTRGLLEITGSFIITK